MNLGLHPISANLLGMFSSKLPQKRHPERSASQIRRVTHRLIARSRRTPRVLILPMPLGAFQHRSPHWPRTIMCDFLHGKSHVVPRFHQPLQEIRVRSTLIAKLLLRERVEFGNTAAEITNFDGIGGQSQPSPITLKCFPRCVPCAGGGRRGLHDKDDRNRVRRKLPDRRSSLNPAPGFHSSQRQPRG